MKLRERRGSRGRRRKLLLTPFGAEVERLAPSIRMKCRLGVDVHSTDGIFFHMPRDCFGGGVRGRFRGSIRRPSLRRAGEEVSNKRTDDENQEKKIEKAEEESNNHDKKSEDVIPGRSKSPAAGGGFGEILEILRKRSWATLEANRWSTGRKECSRVRVKSLFLRSRATCEDLPARDSVGRRSPIVSTWRALRRCLSCHREGR
jgi:hypothetical protein